MTHINHQLLTRDRNAVRLQMDGLSIAEGIHYVSPSPQLLIETFGQIEMNNGVPVLPLGTNRSPGHNGERMFVIPLGLVSHTLATDNQPARYYTLRGPFSENSTKRICQELQPPPEARPLIGKTVEIDGHTYNLS